MLLREGQRIAGDKSHPGATHPLLKLIVLDILGAAHPEASGVRLRSAAMFLAVGICIRSSDGRSKLLQLVMNQLRTYRAALARETAEGRTRATAAGALLKVHDSEVRVPFTCTSHRTNEILSVMGVSGVSALSMCSVSS